MSRSIHVRMLLATAAAALAALGVFVSTSAGSASPNQLAPRPSDLVRQSVKFSTSPPARASSAVYVYEASKIVSLKADHYTTGQIKCPSSHPKPVSGLFDANSTAVYISASFPYKGGWVTRIDNASTTAAKVLIGSVCGA